MTNLRSMKKHLLLIGFLFLSSMAVAQILATDKAQATVSGKTSMAAYTGSSNQLEGNINLESREVSFKIPLESIKTGNGSRDKDMYKALEITSFPEATFYGKIMADFDLEKEENQKVMVKGDFEIHGVARPLEVSVDLKPTPEGVLFYTFWPVNITDFGIKRPSVFFMKVNDEHRIVIEGVLKKEME